MRYGEVGICRIVGGVKALLLLLLLLLCHHLLHPLTPVEERKVDKQSQLMIDIALFLSATSRLSRWNKQCN